MAGGVGVVQEQERGGAVDLVVRADEGQPVALLAHRGADHFAAGELARAAPEQAGVSGELSALRAGAAEHQIAVADVGQRGGDVQGPEVGPYVVCGQRAALVDPVLPRHRDPGQGFGDHGAAGARFGGHGEAVHRAEVRQVHVALAAQVGAAAPEVLPRHPRRRDLDALVPAVVVRPVPGDHVAGERAHRMQVGLRRLEGVHDRSVYVPEEVDVACPDGQGVLVLEEFERHRNTPGRPPLSET